MKKAEEFLYEKYEFTNWEYYPPSREEVKEWLEQFRKEGMEEAYNYGRSISNYKMVRGDYFEFEEWYNNQIKEA